MRNTVVVHYLQGKIVRGITRDFSPRKQTFTVEDIETGEQTTVEIDRLKAVFFVKDLQGNRYHQEKHDAERIGLGKRIRVRFLDGETIIGYTNDYSGSKSAFMVYPADADSNNEKIYVVCAATDEISFSNLKMRSS